MKHLTKVPQGTNGLAALYEASPQNLSEQEVLVLNSYFFSPGFHCIKVPTIEAGRRLLSEYTSSCSHFVDSAFLSTIPIPEEYHNLYRDLGESGALSGEKGSLEEFILQSITHEFLVIEATSDLLKTAWFGRFEQLLIDYDIMKETTIIMFMY